MTTVISSAGASYFAGLIVSVQRQGLFGRHFMGEMGDRSRAVFAEACKIVGLDFILEEQARNHGYLAGTQNGSGISEEAATGETSHRKLRRAFFQVLRSQRWESWSGSSSLQRSLVISPLLSRVGLTRLFRIAPRRLRSAPWPVHPRT